MNQKRYENYRINNIIQTILLFSSMAVLLGVTGWIIGGFAGVKMAMIITVLSFGFSRVMPPHITMKMHRAQPLSPQTAPKLYHINQILAQNAGLKKMPTLYIIPSRKLNAFATGSKANSAIGLTHGLIQTLDANELAGIIGHEISHINNNDIQVMRLAGIFNQMTYYLSVIGQLILLLSLPLIWVGSIEISLLPIAILILAPSMNIMLQLALSRNREYEADLGSARLTGNPELLISALRKLDYYQKQMALWQRIPFPRSGQANMLSTHPPTGKRIKRLESISSKRQYPGSRILLGY